MEWTVVTVVIALVGFLISVTKPILSLNAAITRLTASAERLEKRLEELSRKNHTTHERLFQGQERQNAAINGHEVRLSVLEHWKEQSLS